MTNLDEIELNNIILLPKYMLVLQFEFSENSLTNYLNCAKVTLTCMIDELNEIKKSRSSLQTRKYVTIS